MGLHYHPNRTTKWKTMKIQLLPFSMTEFFNVGMYIWGSDGMGECLFLGEAKIDYIILLRKLLGK